MVKLNRIYTRTGDDGTTGLTSPVRADSKFDLRVEAYGTVDETNACIGLARLHAASEDAEVEAMLGASATTSSISVPISRRPMTGKPLAFEPLRIVQTQVDRIEAEIDATQRHAGAAALLRAARRHACRDASPPRPHGQPPGRAADGRAGRDRRARSSPARR
jgi:cob(I)alamin adenosyltransferase